MQIVFHLGAHCTDEGALVRCLRRNHEVLAEDGIAVPDPALYQTQLRDASEALNFQPTTPDAAQALIDTLAEEDGMGRMVLSFDNFMAFPRWVMRRNQLYPGAADRTAGLAALFPGHEIEFHLAVRNPATFLPALYEKQRDRDYADFVEGSDPLLLRWSDLVERIIEANPAARLTVWCDEDTPLIWPEVLRELSGHDAGRRLAGTDAILAAIMSPEGLARLNDYLASNPPQTEIQRRRIVSAFLDKFALPGEIEMELDLPGWTEDYVEALTAAYDEDMLAIARLPGVTVIAP